MDAIRAVVRHGRETTVYFNAGTSLICDGRVDTVYLRDHHQDGPPRVVDVLENTRLQPPRQHGDLVLERTDGSVRQRIDPHDGTTSMLPPHARWLVSPDYLRLTEPFDNFYELA